MIVRNQLFLRRPWLVPVYSIIGAGVGLWYANAPLTLFTLSLASGLVIAISAWFFWSLKQTRENQKRSN
jgi:hypothetical protein